MRVETTGEGKEGRMERNREESEREGEREDKESQEARSGPGEGGAVRAGRS